MRSWTDWTSENPLRRYRLAHGISINQAASRLGVSHVTINHWEQDTVEPTDENFARIARFVGLDVAQLAADWRRWCADKPVEEEAS